ncbi:Calx-beta domain-containing protein [Sphingomonas lacusdianchii]|uniref:Calx-beta domain-containing protein n=1 Tax=Sphingomonas lacusdianchii TaxID=2917992 RepID=UPI001F5A0EAD|nr:Calx-beta domain-containing protein [Sphingomonas sp. JXJ CY 53]
MIQTVIVDGPLRRGQLNPNEPFYYRPTSYATGGADWTSVPNPGWSINDQVDLAVAHAQTLPNGRQKVVWYSGGRNGMTVASTYIKRELANLDKLVAVADLVIVPGLWKRDFSAADGWQKGGSNRAYTDQINASFPAQLAARYGSKVIYVPLQAIMSDGTADENPKPEFLCDGQTHYSNLGAQACAAAVYDAIKDRFVGHVDTGNLISVAGNTGTVSNGVTGTAPAGFSITKDPTVSVAASIPAAGSVALALTTAVTQATVAEGATITGPTATLANAGNYRARMHVRIEPTSARVVVGGGLLETTAGATPQRAVGMFACRANAYAAVNITTTASASIDTLDATNGLDLYIDTPDMAVGANATVVPYVTIAADQGAVLTINMIASEWSVVRGADSLPTFGFRYAGITKPEGNAGSTTVYGFEVIRSTGAGTVTIPYTFNAGTTDAADYLGGLLPSSGSLTFAEGETSKLINITVVGDNVEESAETFTITLSNPARYNSNGSVVGTGIIVNDDGLQTFAYRDNWTETSAVSITAHTSNSGHTYSKVGTYDMTISPGNNRVRWNAGTGYVRSSYAPANANYDLKVIIRCVRLRAAGIALRMGTDGGCVTVGYSANGASWSCNDRRGDNQLTGYTGGSAVTIELLRWYEMVIKVRGNTFEQWIDGVQVSPTHTFRTNYGTNTGFANITAYSSNGSEGWEYGEISVTEYAA